MKKLSVRRCMMLILAGALLVSCSNASQPPAGSTTDQATAPPSTSPSMSAAAKTPAETPQTSAPTMAAAKPDTPAAPVAELVRIPTGTRLSIVMTDSVGTETSKAGDIFNASLEEPVVVNGKTILAKGTKVKGRVETVDEPGRTKGRAAISLVLTQVINKDKTYAIDTETFSREAEAGTKDDAVKIGGGAAIGALVGALAGGKKGAAIGAGVGGGAGTAAVLATKGKQITIDSETKVNFLLKRAVEIPVIKSSS